MTGPCDVMIFEDDPDQGVLAEALVTNLGYQCRRFLDGHRTLELTAQWRPRLILLDIMMPGVDGLSLCRRLKENPATRSIPVVITSAKPAAYERPRALEAGAAAFVEKPYKPLALEAVVREVLSSKDPKAAAAAVRVTFWGCRGFAPNPTVSPAFGERTSCVQLESAGGECVILDAGTGLETCVDRLLAAGAAGRQATLLLTHYHADHVEGLPSLRRAQQAGLKLRVGGPEDAQVSLDALLKERLEGPLAAPPALLQEQAYTLSPKTRVDVLFALHPTTTLAFAIEMDGRKIVYCPDSEIGEDARLREYEKKLIRFATSADLFVHNAHFTPEDYARSPGIGYSAWPAAVRVAAEASARRLALFHVSRAYDDAQLKALEGQIEARMLEDRRSFPCFLAREGRTVDIP